METLSPSPLCMRTLRPLWVIDLEDRHWVQGFVERISLSDSGLLVELLLIKRIDDGLAI